jgi:hypothetical protein
VARGRDREARTTRTAARRPDRLSIVDAREASTGGLVVTKAENAYDYAGQDPINGYDLDGTRLNDPSGENVGAIGLDLGEQEQVDREIAEEETASSESEVRASQGRPANGVNRVYYDKDYLARTRSDRYHRLTNQEILETVNRGSISEDKPGYVEFRLSAEKFGEHGYFEVGGYYTGRAFVVEHRLFIRVRG